MDDSAYVLWLNSDDILSKRYFQDIIPRDNQFFRLPNHQRNFSPESKHQKVPCNSQDTGGFGGIRKPDDAGEEGRGSGQLSESTVGGKSESEGGCEGENRLRKKQKVGPSAEDQQVSCRASQQVILDDRWCTCSPFHSVLLFSMIPIAFEVQPVKGRMGTRY